MGKNFIKHNGIKQKNKSSSTKSDKPEYVKINREMIQKDNLICSYILQA